MHIYLSTACYHDKHDNCRNTCKFCVTQCICNCHGKVSDRAETKADADRNVVHPRTTKITKKRLIKTRN